MSGESLPSTDSGYERNVDVNLDGVIDGDDMCFVGARFGELVNEGSTLRATVPNPLPADPDTVTLQPLPSEGDLLTIRILVNDSDDNVSAADFAVTYGPADGDPSQVLELLGFTQGSYLASRLKRRNAGEAATRLSLLRNRARVIL